jgi:hypothetical protein
MDFMSGFKTSHAVPVADVITDGVSCAPYKFAVNNICDLVNGLNRINKQKNK